MNNKKFRVWDNIQKKFEYFELGNITFPDRLLSQHSYPVQQFLGILDKNMKEIYEGDVVKFVYSFNEYKEGVVLYMNDYCAYAIHYDNGYVPIMNVVMDSLEIVGIIKKDYIWNEEGNLIKNEQ